MNSNSGKAAIEHPARYPRPYLVGHWRRTVIGEGGDAIGNADEACFVSAVTAFEIANKVRIGKLAAGAEIAANMDRIMEENRFAPLPVSMAHSLKTGSMPGEPRDPFDRLLAAQSLIEGIPLVTIDPVFKAFGVTTVW